MRICDSAVRLVLDAKSERPGPAGSIIVRAAATGVGVFDYPGAGTVDFRSPEEVFSDASLKSLTGVPVTKLHPTDPKGVTPENFRELSIGHFMNPIANRKEGTIEGDVQINDAEAIKDFRSGKLRECSGGYEAERVEDAGEYEGKAYTHRQKDITYNHLALGPNGWNRQGSKIRILDHRENNQMIIIDGKDFATEAEAIKYLQGKSEATEATLAGEKTAHEKTKQLLKDAADPKAINARVKERSALVAVAKAVLIDADEEKSAEETEEEEEAIEDKDDLTLKKEIIAKSGLELPADASEAYIEGAYAVAAKQAQSASKAAPVADSKDVVRPIRIGVVGKTPKTKIDDGSERLEKAVEKQNQRDYKPAMSK